MENNYLSTREFLEQAMKQAKERHEAKNKSTPQSEQSPSKENKPLKAEEKQKPICLSAEWAEKFEGLTPEWQEYLCRFERAVLDEASALNLHHMPAAWLNDLFLMRDKTFAGDCENARQWVEKLAFAEHLLQAHPRQMLNALAELYLAPREPATNACACFLDYYKERRNQDARAWIEKRLSATNKQGAPCFKHYKSVLDMVVKLLSTQMAGDVATAYNQAVWLDEDVRAEMIEEAVQERIRQKAQEAQEAKEKAFLKEANKTAVVAGDKPKTTREFLEEAFKKYRTAA